MVELVTATIRRRLKYDVAAAVEEERPQRDLLLDPGPGRGNTTTSISRFSLLASRFAWFAPLLEPCHVSFTAYIIITTLTNLRVLLTYCVHCAMLNQFQIIIP